MTPPQDKRDTLKPSESKVVGTSDQNSHPHGSESSSESWLKELWHSTKYAFVQTPYDAIRQDVNHLASAVSKDSQPLSEHQFIDPMHWRDDFSGVGIAQDVGSAIGTLPYFMAAQAGLKKLMPEKMIAESLPLLADGRAQNVLRTAVAGGLVNGLLTPVADDGNWTENKFKTATAGFVTFAVAGAGMEYLGKNSLAAKIGGAELKDRLAQATVERASNSIVGALSGGAGALIGNETSSLVYDHKLAEGADLSQKSLKAAAMMATLSALGRRGSLSTERFSGIDLKSGDAPDVQSANSVPRPIETAISAQILNSVPRPIERTISTNDEPVPKPIEKAKAKSADDLEAKPDAKQAARLEKQAAQLAGKGEFGKSAQRLAVAVDCLETLKTQGSHVDETHLTELYRTLSTTRLRADERDQPIPVGH